MTLTGAELLIWLTIASLLGGGVNALVLSPINKNIEALSDAIKALTIDIEKSKEDRRYIDARLTRVEESTKSAHKRITEIKEECVECRN